MTVLCDAIWRFFESIHDYIVGTLDWLIEKLRPLGWAIAVFDLVAGLLLLVVLLRACFQ